MPDETKTERLPFFVYGTLRIGEGNWRRYLEGRTLRQIPAILPDHKLFVDTFPFVTDASDGSQVVGELVYVKDETYSGVMRDLDRLEQYDPTTDSGWYLRVVREVECAEPVESAEDSPFRRVRAWVYHGGPEVIAGMGEAHRVKDGDWLKYQEQNREQEHAENYGG
jgi:gamma-glutamylcyclotransferase (GGCT)/AIG2-like uncharacterized protein YtfP